MKAFFQWLALTLVGVVAWGGINLLAFDKSWFVESAVPAGDREAFAAYASDRIRAQSNGNAALLLLDAGVVSHEVNHSRGRPVTADSVFGVSSVSKWVAAIGVMRLVEQGKLDLDAPVSNYLTRWSLPDSEFDNNGVTVRRLLSHTAGLTDGLGHDGFASRNQVQPLTEHLTRAKDADPDVSGEVRVGLQPGSSFKYSGGGYNLLQLVVEEVTGMSFADYMQQQVLMPLGMTRSTYDPDRATDPATYFDAEGQPRAYPYYTSLAATGLHASARDLARLLAFHATGQTVAGAPPPVSPETLELMREPHAQQLGADIWGLGTILYARDNHGSFVIGHGGQSPALNASVRFNPATGDGFVLLTTGNRSLAADVGTEWTLWQTGNADIYLQANLIPRVLLRTLIGAAVIAALSALWVVVRRRRRRAESRKVRK
ncbi:serine hydrolase domain-containing protein [Elongatibacter sediminis]|uniref:Serine hydrolase domain-containing protein n=1 Tax=Elongatibacter sediminis TaxID=3119006 RepID=A0AAW9R6M9_9GAMM